MKLIMKLILIFILMISTVTFAWQPSKPITLVLGFPPGGGSSALLRVAATQVERNTGVHFVILNKPGAGSAIANEYIAREVNDGHNVLVGSMPAIYATDRMLLPNKKYGTKDFTAATFLFATPMVIIAHPDDPVSSIKEFIKVTRTEPVTFGDPGSAARLTYELLADAVKFTAGPKNVVRVEYKGPADVVTGVMGKHIRFGIVPSSVVLGAFSAQKIKIIAVTSNHTTPLLAGVPSITDIYPNMNFSLEMALLLPANTPAEIANWYSTEFSKALESLEVKEVFIKNLMFANKKLQDPVTLQSYIIQEEKKYSAIVDKVISEQK